MKERIIMNKTISKTVLRFLYALFALVFAILPLSAAKTAIVSPGLGVIAGGERMIKSGLLYSDVTFSPVDFERALGVSRIASITLVSVPDPTDGTLMLAEKKLSAGDTVERKSISGMSFVPASSDVRESSFSFYSSLGAHEIVCSMYVLPAMNFAPTTSMATDSSLSVVTSKDISFFGTLSAYDPENDALTFEIITPPKNGTLTLTNKNSGDYRYTPDEGFTGKDRFSYLVRDKYGNYSDITTVGIKVAKSGSSLVFADMDGHWAEGAAIFAASKGLIDGRVAGGQTYFYPDEEVSRADFLVMLMKAAGIDGVSDCPATIFTDDGDIRDEIKGYVAEALSRGYIHGSYTSSGIFFKPNDGITRAEAAVMINNILCAETPAVLPVFTDIDSVPAWAKSALYSLSSLGIFKGTGGGNISPDGTINRAQAAQIIYSIYKLR